MSDFLLDLERGAQDGSVDPVRVLVELDRRGMLSRGSEIVVRAHGKRPDPSASASTRRYGSGLGPSFQRIAPFRHGFVVGYLTGLPRNGTFPQLLAEADAAASGQLNGITYRGGSTRGVSAFTGAFSMLQQLDGAITSVELQPLARLLAAKELAFPRARWPFPR